MPKTVIALSVFLVLGSALFSGGSAVQAQGTAGEEIGKQLEAATGQGGANLGTPVDPRVTIVLIIRFLLNLTGLVLLGLILYAGYLWMTAGGNEEQVTKAKQLIRNAVIGLIIVLSAYSITIFAANLARGFITPLGGVQPFLPK